MVQNLTKHWNFTGNVCVCVCVCVQFVFKGPKRFNHSFYIFQFIRGQDQNWGKNCYFLQIHFVSVLLMFFTIVVFINKASKLIKLVLVVYCDSCCHWWYPGNSAGQKNVWKAQKPPGTPLWVYICLQFTQFCHSFLGQPDVSSLIFIIISTASSYYKKDLIKSLLKRTFIFFIQCVSIEFFRNTQSWQCWHFCKLLIEINCKEILDG